ncbi:hypothetical protein [Bacillus sp. AFS014408]|uniref:hypothetical protein n=1 Tax=Bacillus sp. AFS014408 TaxID=2034278 RepID=UPI0015969651|nr:hypothetical protein [Bacillus sp. AFS014408]
MCNKLCIKGIIERIGEVERKETIRKEDKIRKTVIPDGLYLSSFNVLCGEFFYHNAVIS